MRYARTANKLVPLLYSITSARSWSHTWHELECILSARPAV